MRRKRYPRSFRAAPIDYSVSVPETLPWNTTVEYPACLKKVRTSDYADIAEFDTAMNAMFPLYADHSSGVRLSKGKLIVPRNNWVQLDANISKIGGVAIRVTGTYGNNGTSDEEMDLAFGAVIYELPSYGGAAVFQPGYGNGDFWCDPITGYDTVPATNRNRPRRNRGYVLVHQAKNVGGANGFSTDQWVNGIRVTPHSVLTPTVGDGIQCLNFFLSTEGWLDLIVDRIEVISLDAHPIPFNRMRP